MKLGFSELMFKKASKCKKKDRQSGKKEKKRESKKKDEWENDRKLTPNDFGF